MLKHNTMRKRYCCSLFHPFLSWILLLCMIFQAFSYSAKASEALPSTEETSKDIIPTSIIANYKDNPSGTGAIERNVSFEYSHSMLTNHCGEYRPLPDLAKASIYLATAAYNNSDGTSIQALMQKMGYAIKYTSPWYTNKMPYDDTHHVAFEIGSADYDGKTIYLVAIRGTCDPKEWYSDFEFGTGVDHYGFNQAALEVLSEIGDLVEHDNTEPEDTIIWTTGHSRGAAVSDMVAGFMSLCADYSHGIPQDNIFSYNYACPSSTRRSITTLKNIYNYVNPYDIIPKLPFTDDGWDYRRFGETIYLSTSGGFFYNMRDQFAAVAGQAYEFTNTGAYTSVIYSIAPQREDVQIPEIKLVLRIFCNALFVKDNGDYKKILIDYFKDASGVSSLTDEDLNKIEGWLSKAQFTKIYNFLKEKATKQIIKRNLVASLYLIMHAIKGNVFFWEALTDTETNENTGLRIAVADAQNETINMEDQSEEWFQWLSDHSEFVNKVKNKLGHDITEKQDLVDAELLLEAELSDYRNILSRLISATRQTGSLDLIKPIAHSHTMITYQYWINSMYYGYHGWRNAANPETIDFTRAGSTIGEGCFSGVSGLTDAVLPEQVMKICKYAFQGSDVTVLDIKAEAVKVDESAFQNCTGLKTVTIPGDSEYGIGKNAGPFTGCTEIEKVTYTKGRSGIVLGYYSASTNIYHFGNISMEAEESLKEVEFEEGITEIKDDALRSKGSKREDGSYKASIENVTFPSTLEKIGACAFRYQDDLTELNLPESVTEIGSYAFSECGITNVVIPSGVAKINTYTFSNCKNLETLVIPDGVRDLDYSAFLNCTGLREVSVPGDADYHKDRYSGPFTGCTGIEKVIYTNGISGIVKAYYSTYSSTYNFGNISMEAEENLKEVVFEEGITEIRDDALRSRGSKRGDGSYIAGIESITWPSTLEKIGARAFRYQDDLTELNLPESVTEIGNYAFSGCGITNVMIPSGVTTISDYAFSDCKNLETLVIPDNVRTIQDAAFSNCTGLREVTVPGDASYSLDTGNRGPFSGCTGIEKVTYTKGISGIVKNHNYLHPAEINKEAEESLKEAVFEEGITEIEYEVLQGRGDKRPDGSYKAGIETITLPSTLEKIGARAFRYQDDLTVFNLPEGLTSIGAGAFAGCSALSTIYFNGNAPTIQSDSMSSVTATAYYPAANITWTEDFLQNYGGNITWVAYSSSDLPLYNNTTLMLPSNLKTIESESFSGLTQGVNIVVPDTVTHIENDAFEGSSVIIISVPGGYVEEFCNEHGIPFNAGLRR